LATLSTRIVYIDGAQAERRKPDGKKHGDEHGSDPIGAVN
jgi:hypothetical protein